MTSIYLHKFHAHVIDDEIETWKRFDSTFWFQQHIFTSNQTTPLPQYAQWRSYALINKFAIYFLQSILNFGTHTNWIFCSFFSVVIIIKYAKVSLRMFFQKKLSFYVNTRNGVFLLEKESISKKESWFVTLCEIFFYKWIINL